MYTLETKSISLCWCDYQSFFIITIYQNNILKVKECHSLHINLLTIWHRIISINHAILGFLNCITQLTFPVHFLSNRLYLNKVTKLCNICVIIELIIQIDKLLKYAFSLIFFTFILWESQISKLNHNIKSCKITV